MKSELITILGPTASGKTRLAVTIAASNGGEIISADSRQVFRGMDIGSGKDLHEYGTVPYHLIDIRDAGEEFNVFAFQRLFLETFSRITDRGSLPILCGGSGMYLDAVLRGYRMVEVPRDESLRGELANKNDGELVEVLKRLRPELHNSTDLHERERTVRAIEIARGTLNEVVGEPFPRINGTVIGIQWERGELRRRIAVRLEDRLENGMIEEVEALNAAGVTWERLDYYGLEYRYVGAFLRGELTRNELSVRLHSAICDFAKRQGNWFRRMERHGIVINWVDGAADPAGQAGEILQREGVLASDGFPAEKRKMAERR